MRRAPAQKRSVDPDPVIAAPRGACSRSRSSASASSGRRASRSANRSLRLGGTAVPPAAGAGDLDRAVDPARPGDRRPRSFPARSPRRGESRAGRVLRLRGDRSAAREPPTTWKCRPRRAPRLPPLAPPRSPRGLRRAYLLRRRRKPVSSRPPKPPSLRLPSSRAARPRGRCGRPSTSEDRRTACGGRPPRSLRPSADSELSSGRAAGRV